MSSAQSVGQTSQAQAVVAQSLVTGRVPTIRASTARRWSLAATASVPSAAHLRVAAKEVAAKEVVVALAAALVEKVVVALAVAVAAMVAVMVVALAEKAVVVAMVAVVAAMVALECSPWPTTPTCPNTVLVRDHQSRGRPSSKGKSGQTTGSAQMKLVSTTQRWFSESVMLVPPAAPPRMRPIQATGSARTTHARTIGAMSSPASPHVRSVVVLGPTKVEVVEEDARACKEVAAVEAEEVFTLARNLRGL